MRFLQNCEVSRGTNDVEFCEMKGFTYILECIDNTYYTGSTKNIQRRLMQHKQGMGANYTKQRRPLTLVYIELHPRIDLAFHREKQIQAWSHQKKKALIENQPKELIAWAKKCFNL